MTNIITSLLLKQINSDICLRKYKTTDEIRKQFWKDVYSVDNGQDQQFKHPLSFAIYFSVLNILDNPMKKFIELKSTLNCPFYSDGMREQVLGYYCDAQRHYYALLKFANHWRKHNTKIRYNCDLYLNPIDTTKVSSIIIQQAGCGYMFKLSDLINIINKSLMNCCGEFFVDSLNPKNPYTNIPFSNAILYAIYRAIRSSDYKIPLLFELFYQCEFDIDRFVYENETIIRDKYIDEFVKNSSSTILYPYVKKMIRFVDENRRWCIHKDFPMNLLVDIMRPYLLLYIIHTYSMSQTYKNHCCYDKLKNKLDYFIKKYPLFGRKRAFGQTFNIEHPTFSYSDQYTSDDCTFLYETTSE